MLGALQVRARRARPRLRPVRSTSADLGDPIRDASCGRRSASRRRVTSARRQLRGCRGSKGHVYAHRRVRAPFRGPANGASRDHRACRARDDRAPRESADRVSRPRELRTLRRVVADRRSRRTAATSADDQAPTLVADCLANGLPTVVSDLDWAGELPPDAAEKVPSDVSPHVLKDRITELLGDSGRRAALSRGAVARARACSFASIADAYLDALGLD